MKKAFTLAEVLVTLSIIGVVSALTVPALTNRISEKQVVEKVKTAYSFLSDAFSKAKMDNGDFETWDISEYNTRNGAEKLQSYFEPYFKTISTDNDFCSLNVLTLDGGIVGSYCSQQWSKPIVLQNGMSLIFWSSGHNEGTQQSAVMVDINGIEAPNQYGIDLFQFHVSPTSNRLIPSGSKEGNIATDLSTRCNKKASGYNNGKDCTAWVLYKGNMDYKRKQINW